MSGASPAGSLPDPSASTPPTGAAPIQDAGLVRWATRLKHAGYVCLALAIVPIFLADQYRRIGGLLLIPGLILWWLCLTVRHWCLARSWPPNSPQRRRGLVTTVALAIPLVLLGIGLAGLAF